MGTGSLNSILSRARKRGGFPAKTAAFVNASSLEIVSRKVGGLMTHKACRMRKPPKTLPCRLRSWGNMIWTEDISVSFILMSFFPSSSCFPRVASMKLWRSLDSSPEGCWSAPGALT